MPKVVISGYYGFKNNGDEAMLYSILKVLEQKIPAIEPVVLSKQPRETSGFYGVKAIPRHNLRLIIRELRKADLLLSGSGGLLQDTTGPNSILYYLGIVALARCLGKPVVFYGQGVGPVRTLLGKTMMRLVANGVNRIIVRDEESQRELKSLGVCKPPVHVTADPALGLEPLDIDARLGLDILANLGVQPGTPLMGVSVRPWKDLHAYKAVIAKVCDQAVQQGLQVIFLPMHYPGDVEVSQEIAAKMQRPCIMVARELNFLEMLSLMKHVRIIMGMRLHFLIFGALLHIPMVGISYDPKVDRFLDLVQMPSGGLVEHLQYEDLLAQVSDVLEQEKALKQQLAQQMPGLREKALESAGLVAEVLKACKKNEA